MTAQELHDSKVHTLAESYRDRGYEVILEPAPGMIPGFDSSLRPDLLAKKNRDQIVVEVKSRSALRDSDTVRRMADALARIPDWRFELVLLEDAAIEPNQAADTKSIHAQLDSAELLLKHGQPASSFVLVWISVESILRRIALAHSLEIADASPIRLIRELTFNGLLSREDYTVLDQQLQLRNQIVHGFNAPALTVRGIEQLRDLAARLVASGESQTVAA